jgi:hypothetical protein
MILEKGDMWSVYGETDLFLFTGNGYVTKMGRLVMGAGMAKQVRDRFPGIDLAIGEMLVQDYRRLPDVFMYYLLVSQDFPKKKVGIFQVKRKWSYNADLEIIKISTDELLKFLSRKKVNKVDLNFPGIGNGNLKREDVLPTISALPDNVHVWEY